MEDVFEFTWEVPQDGFKWVKANVLEGTPAEMKELSEGNSVEMKELDFILTDGQPLGAARKLRRYTPLKLYTGLFRTFAETPDNADGILAFANTYGSLGEKRMLIALHHEGQLLLGTGEHISLWHKEIFFMRQALELWDAVNDNDLDLLRERIEWVGEGVRYGHGSGGQWIASPEFHPERLERFRPGDLAAPALYVVQGIVNKRLQGRISPQLLWDKDRIKLGLYIVPNSLIGAIWLQFAQAIDGHKEYRRCEECRIWFELSPEVARTSKLYCSNACRVRAYRKRQAEARRLHEEGKSIEEIARIIGTDISTAQGWILKGGTTNGEAQRPR